MTKKEQIEYLQNSGLYNSSDNNLYYEKRMINSNKTIPISELVERFIKIDKEFRINEPTNWNLRQILRNIDMIIPLEDREYNGEEPVKHNLTVYHEYGDDVTTEKKTIYSCPNCNRNLMHGFERMKYCDECGTKINWGEE